MVAQIGAPVEMGAGVSLELRDLKEVPMLGGGEGQGLFEQRPQGAAEPVVGGDVETGLLSRENRRTEFAAHHVPQDHLLP